MTKNTYLRFRSASIVAAGLTSILLGAASASAQSLGNAESYAIVGGTAVTAAGVGSVINGNVGVSPGTSITGFPAGATVVPPFATHANDASAVAAQASVGALYTTLAGIGGATNILPELGGVVLTPGTYSFSTTANIAAGTTLTLSGAGTYIFKVGSALTANVGSSVVLANGATACNIFWQITSAATLNGTTFSGNVVAQSGVTLGVGASLNGRALNTPAGPVTLSGGNTVGGCSSAPAVCPVITLSPPVLPPGAVGVSYNQAITASGGAAPYTFTVTSGTLPAGLTLTTTGVLAGTPTAAGTATVTIQGTDANGCFASIVYTIVIAAVPPVCPVITINPPTLPTGAVGVAYSQTFTGSGGTAPYTFSVTQGTLPAGLTLSATGVLSGTPTAVGSTTFTVRGTDANGCFAERIYTIVIACPVITLAPPTLPAGTTGVAYSRTITASGGTGPYVFTVTSGALPAGLTLTPAGVVAGTPTTAGTTNVTIRGTDASGCFAEVVYTIAVATAVPTLPQAFMLLLALGLIGAAYLRLRQCA